MLTERVQQQLKTLNVAGLIVTLIGLLLLFKSVFFLKTYVTEMPDLSGLSPEVAASVANKLQPENTHSIGLIARQQAFVLFGGFTLLSGLILWGLSFLGRLIVEQPSIS